MKILLIEDDRDMAATIQEALSSLYHVDAVHTGESGAYKAKTSSYDLIIVDLLLPDINGVSVCKQIRGKHITTPILCLTGRYSVEDKVAALDAGADDYVTKPFFMTELLARIRALIRRSAHSFTPVLMKQGELVLNQQYRTVMHKNKPLFLRRREFDLLMYMMQHPGQVLTRSNILDHVWEADVDPLSNTIDVHIKYLRDKIDRPFGTRLIQTVPGVGYKLAI